MTPKGSADQKRQSLERNERNATAAQIKYNSNPPRKFIPKG